MSFTVPANVRSRAVMERIGMRHDPADDFDHPKLPVGHPLRRHVLYRLARADWRRDGVLGLREQLRPDLGDRRAAEERQRERQLRREDARSRGSTPARPPAASAQ